MLNTCISDLIETNYSKATCREVGGSHMNNSNKWRTRDNIAQEVYTKPRTLFAMHPSACNYL